MSKKETYGQFKSVLKFVSNVVSWTAFLVLILIAGALVFYAVSVQLYASKGETYEPPFSLYTIISTSMEPTILLYDVIVDVPVKDANDLKQGDVITFISTNRLNLGMTVTHRIDDIVEVDGQKQFVTKGDAVMVQDTSLVTIDDILGKVIFKIPQLGRIQFFLASKGGWLFVIVIPALGIIIYDVLKVFKVVGVKKQVKELDDENNLVDIEKEKKEKKRKEKLKKKFKSNGALDIDSTKLPVIYEFIPIDLNIYPDMPSLAEDVPVNDEVNNENAVRNADIPIISEVVTTSDEEEFELPKLKN